MKNKHDFLAYRLAAVFALAAALMMGFAGCRKAPQRNGTGTPTPSEVPNSPTPRPTPKTTPRPTPKLDDVLRLSKGDELSRYNIFLNTKSLDKDALIVYKDAAGMAMAEYISLIPLRAVGEGLKLHVEWRASTRSVFVNGQKAPVPIILFDGRSYLEDSRAEVFFGGTVKTKPFDLQHGIVGINVVGFNLKGEK